MGNKERIETGKAPLITIGCRGDLRVKGWAEPAVRLNGQMVTHEQTEKGYNIESDGDLSLMVPLGSLIHLTEVSGDLAMKNLETDLAIDDVKGDASLLNLGGVTLQNIRGDLSVKNLSGTFIAKEILGDCILRNVLDVQLGTVHGDCAARNVNGKLDITEVNGDFVLRTINGDVTIEKCARDANLRNIGGRVISTQVLGDVRLRGSLASGKHQISAGGDIVVLWPSETPLVVEANASSIKNKLPLLDVVQDESSLSGRLGEDGPVLIMNAKGRIILKDLDKAKDPWDQTANGDYTFDLGFDLADLGEQISDEINAHMTSWSQRMENELGPKFSANVEKKAQEAAAKAEKAANRAVRRAEKAANRSRWAAGTGPQNSQGSQSSANKQANKASEEEQLKILRMVESGVISPEDAGTLLDALEY